MWSVYCAVRTGSCMSFRSITLSVLIPFFFSVTIVCSLVVVYQHAGGIYYLYLPGQQPLCMEAVTYFWTFVNIADGDSAESVLCLETSECVGPGRGSFGLSRVCHRGGSGSIPDPSVWDMWWTEWHWDWFFPPSTAVFPGHCLSLIYHLRCIILAVDSVVQ